MTMGEGFYPYRLVPYKGLKRKMDLSAIIDNGEDFAVARRFDGKAEDLLVELSPEYHVFRNTDDTLEALYKEIPQLSMTIIGAMTGFDDMKYIQHDHAKEDWDGTTHQITDFINSVSIANEYFCVVYRASAVHRQPVEYEKRFDSKDDFKKNLGFINSSISGNEQILLNNFSSKKRYPMQNGRLELVHRPTMLNYWHVELMVLPASLLEEDRLKNVKFKKDRSPQQYNDKDLMVRFVWKTYLCQNFDVMTNCVGEFPMEYSYDTNISEEERQRNAEAVRVMYSTKPILPQEDLLSPATR